MSKIQVNKVEQNNSSVMPTPENELSFQDHNSLEIDLKALPIQRKLAVGAVDDPLEKEANTMADKIMRMPENSLIQRKCSECDEEDKLRCKPITSFIQKKSLQGENVVSDSVSNQINSSKGKGSPLSGSTKSFMESRFGSDFSKVNIHNGGEASHLSRDLGAKAFAVGNDIYFNSGQYAPDTSEGKRLLAHELTHTIQQGDKSTIQRVPVCYDPNQTPTGPTAREPENHPTYEGWIASFHGMTSFESDETFRFTENNGSVSTGALGDSFTVIGDQPADRDSSVRTGIPVQSADPPTSMRSSHPGDRFIDHPTDAFVIHCLPDNLRATAYQLRSDCADIAVILRHVWLSAHRRVERYNGWIVGDNRGRANEPRVNQLINSVASGNVAGMLNPYSNESGQRLVSFAELAPLLHPGDILVWEHHKYLIDTPPRIGRSGGHTQTISHIERDSNGNITGLELLQGNQPIFGSDVPNVVRGAEEIINEMNSRNMRHIPSESTLRNAPSRRVEVGSQSSLNLRDVTFPMDIRSGSIRTRGPIWTWMDNHTTLVAAGPSRAARRPTARARNSSGQRVRRITDWTTSFRSANRNSLAGIWEAMLLETRSLLERDQNQVQNQISNADAISLGRSMGQRFRNLYLTSSQRRLRIATNYTQQQEYMQKVAEFISVLEYVATHSQRNLLPIFDAIARTMANSATAGNLEEGRSFGSFPRQVLTGSLFPPIIDGLFASFRSATNFRQALSIAVQSAINLWNTSSQLRRLNPNSVDDRPLYWARLQMISILRTTRPGFLITTTERDDLIKTFENHSRGRDSINFSNEANSVKVLISGFDPFSLESNIAQQNPSGAIALGLDDTIIQGTPIEIQSIVFPVRFRDFNEGNVEQFFSAFLQGSNAVDMIITISRGSGRHFEIEGFAARRRASTYHDNEGIYSGGSGNSPIVPPNLATGNSSNEIVDTTLPHQAVSNTSNMVFDNDRRNSLDSSGRSIRGAGGGYLSNEIFYRVQMLNISLNGLQRTIPMGHLHTPSEGMDIDTMVVRTRQAIQSGVVSILNSRRRAPMNTGP